MKEGQERYKTMTVPWIHGYNWSEATLSITTTIAAIDGELNSFKEIAQQICGEYLTIDNDLDRIAEKTCTSCRNVCCTHATVWYDLRDLLYLYLCNGTLPEQQIYRQEDGSCSHLNATGCNMSRTQRPFICTWYICASQKESVRQNPIILRKIEKIKTLRKQLEQQYMLKSKS